MQATIKSNTEVEKNSDLEAIMNDIASLKRDVGALAEHLKSGAVDSVTEVGRNAAARVSDEARRLYGNLADQGQHSVKALSRHVEEQPVTSLLFAFALGMIGSRLLSR
jgi:ElaB/YqjD/DUF883 family membrane-anchored ribosome-binding protein